MSAALQPRQYHVTTCPNYAPKGTVRPGRTVDCPCRWWLRLARSHGQRQVWGDNRQECIQAYHAAMAEAADGPLPDRTATVGQLVRRYVDQAKGPDGKPWAKSTVRKTGCYARKHILSAPLADYKVLDVRRTDVRKWYAAMEAAGAGPGARFDAIGILHAAFNAWLADDRPLPVGNPVEFALAPKFERKEHPGGPLTTAEVGKIAEGFPPEVALIVPLHAYCGCRQSEVRALQERDIEWQGKDVTRPLAPQLAALAALQPDQYDARRAVLHIRRKLEEDHTEGPTKNRRAVRDLPLPQWLAADLAAHLTAWPAPPAGWLFAKRRQDGGNGSLIPASEVTDDYGYFSYRNHWQRALKAAGLAHRIPSNQCTHSLRHHCVAILRDEGFSDDAIGEWIGDTAATVRKTYGAPMGDTKQRIAATITRQREAARQQPRLRAV